MSNDSKRDDDHAIRPSELQASDFFPPGEGWNKKATPERGPRERQDDDTTNGGRPH